jgi:solute carrier family 25 (mitochondrial carnitine/acylcarnitine transporter), member 20/29
MVDVIKSRLQTDIIGPGRKYSGAFDCAIQSFRNEGLGSFFRGIGPTLCRAAPVNAMVTLSL